MQIIGEICKLQMTSKLIVENVNHENLLQKMRVMDE